MKKLLPIALLLLLAGGPEILTPLASGPETSKEVPGVSYEHYRNRLAPWSVHVIRIDRSKTDFELHTSLGAGDHLGATYLSDQLSMFPKAIGKPIAAVNGDFFNIRGGLAGDPRGLQVQAGELISAPGESTAFWIDKNGNPSVDHVESEFTFTWKTGEKVAFGLNEDRAWTKAVLYTAAMGPSTRARGGTEFVLEGVEKEPWLPLQLGRTYKAKIREIRGGGNSRLRPDIAVLSMPMLNQVRGASSAAVGDIVTISTATSPNLEGIRTAIGGGPALLKDGKPLGSRAYKGYERHPRAAIGWNKNEFFFVGVDGRQQESMGMTLAELSEIMARLKCEEGMNLDGGGSVEVWFNGQIVNSPCQGERQMANALVLVEKKKESKP